MANEAKTITSLLNIAKTGMELPENALSAFQSAIQTPEGKRAYTEWIINTWNSPKNRQEAEFLNAELSGNSPLKEASYPEGAYLAIKSLKLDPNLQKRFESGLLNTIANSVDPGMGMVESAALGFSDMALAGLGNKAVRMMPGDADLTEAKARSGQLSSSESAPVSRKFGQAAGLLADPLGNVIRGTLKLGAKVLPKGVTASVEEFATKNPFKAKASEGAYIGGTSGLAQGGANAYSENKDILSGMGYGTAFGTTLGASAGALMSAILRNVASRKLKISPEDLDTYLKLSPSEVEKLKVSKNPIDAAVVKAYEESKILPRDIKELKAETDFAQREVEDFDEFLTGPNNKLRERQNLLDDLEKDIVGTPELPERLPYEGKLIVPEGTTVPNTAYKSPRPYMADGKDFIDDLIDGTKTLNEYRAKKVQLADKLNFYKDLLNKMESRKEALDDINRIFVKNGLGRLDSKSFKVNEFTEKLAKLDSNPEAGRIALDEVMSSLDNWTQYTRAQDVALKGKVPETIDDIIKSDINAKDFSSIADDIKGIASIKNVEKAKADSIFNPLTTASIKFPILSSKNKVLGALQTPTQAIPYKMGEFDYMSDEGTQKDLGDLVSEELTGTSRVNVAGKPITEKDKEKSRLQKLYDALFGE